MNLLSALALAATVVSTDSTDEDLCQDMVIFAKAYPYHACAVFRDKPVSKHNKDGFPGAPDRFFGMKKTAYVTPVYFCIPRSKHGDWMVRRGPGGSHNWCFDHKAFNLTNGRRITVI
ncbi:hypothetical protein DSO57_1033674 [Entomophthora muscae]|uniref:Uncharacterized protein n=1 Tax=Entomophthora muscae TaxID=34485 RepID=A0ACC2SPA7_9FUNG|nr:hypothetical protein DSO57_1033674 [Entomophthora muscae]